MKFVPVLHTHRCTLSAVTWNDFPVLREILDDSETQRFLPELCEEIQTEESLQQLVVSFDNYLLRDEGILWGIETEGALAGFVAIMDISYDSILFYAMHPNYRNQGYAKEAVSEVVRYFKEKYPNLNLHTRCTKTIMPPSQSCNLTVSWSVAERMKKF